MAELVIENGVLPKYSYTMSLHMCMKRGETSLQRRHRSNIENNEHPHVRAVSKTPTNQIIVKHPKG